VIPRTLNLIPAHHRSQSDSSLASHRYHCSAHKFPLLLLPNDVLQIIAKMMGKRASLTCSRLRQARGSPGTHLCLPYAEMPSLQPSTSPGPTTPYLPFLQAWQHPVTYLELGKGIVVDGPSCQAIAEALPNLRQLKCENIDPARNSSSHGIQLNALTHLYTTTTANDLSAMAALAPHLRSLTICTHNLTDTPPLDDGVWAPLVSLSCLQHLHVPLRSVHLSAFPDAMRDLTGLTHLGLNLFYNPHEALDHLQPLVVAALAAMPLLASIYIAGFTMLVPLLAPALQSMAALRHLGLEECYWNNAGPAPAPATSTVGCLPDISTMPLLESFTAIGMRVVDPDNTWHVSSSTQHGALRALQLARMDFAHHVRQTPAPHRTDVAHAALGVFGQLHGRGPDSPPHAARSPPPAAAAAERPNPWQPEGTHPLAHEPARTDMPEAVLRAGGPAGV
jgi:hypothetical protein